MGFDPGKIRDWANDNSAAVTIGAIVVMIASLALLWINMRGPSRSGPSDVPDVYFYDVDTKKFFVAAHDELPPIDTESGTNKGFRAFIFGCGGCGSDGGDLEGKSPKELQALNLFVGYYEGFTPEHKKAVKEAKAKADAGDPSAVYYMEEGFGEGVMRSADGVNWFPANSEQAIEINRNLGKKCPSGSRLKQCYPGR